MLDIKTHMCEAYAVIQLTKEGTTMRENPAYGEVSAIMTHT